MTEKREEEIQALLQRRNELEESLKALPYTGTTEIKTTGKRRYIYVRKLTDGKLTTTYIGRYSDELLKEVRGITAEGKAIRKELRHIALLLNRLDASGEPESTAVL